MDLHPTATFAFLSFQEFVPRMSIPLENANRAATARETRLTSDAVEARAVGITFRRRDIRPDVPASSFP